MSRRSDPFWRYVKKTANGFWKCVFCGIEFHGSTSITRIKYHLARVERGGANLCEYVTPDVRRAASDQLHNRMRGSMPSSSNNIIVTEGSDRAQDLEMLNLAHDHPKPEGEKISTPIVWQKTIHAHRQIKALLDDENVAPGMPMPDAPETGLGTEPADQPFEMDNISSSLMQSVAERGTSSKRPVDRSVPSSSNNEATNAASTPVRDYLATWRLASTPVDRSVPFALAQLTALKKLDLSYTELENLREGMEKKMRCTVRSRARR